MNPLILFCSGLLIGISLYFFHRKESKKLAASLRDKNARLEQEKKIVIEFMHNLAVAIGEGIPRKELYQRIAHTAVITTGALSTCVYEKLPNGKLQSVATEGLFPPQRKLKSPIEETSSTRARFLEKILTSEILEEGEGIIGEVAKTGKAVYVPRAENDPRIINGTNFIRDFSLDEIPQLINVFKGEMSIVGPRPLFDEDTKLFDARYMRRLNVIPGITGLLQINDRNTDNFSVWFKYDLSYIENWSIYLDLKIMLQTPLAILRKNRKGL